jgi:UDP-N-acetylglucosamine 2-epimerase (non-hydrolysing)
VHRFVIVFGTRPEAIKLAPVVLQLRSDPACEALVCVTAQQREMLDQVLEFFDIKPDIDLNLMRPNQGLAEFAGRAIPQLERAFAEIDPDMVIVQGDTNTTFHAALAAFYRQVPVAHVEAGLRTGDIYSPFPEEANRLLTSRLAALHFPPTRRAADNLLAEGYPAERVFITGNTGIDALLMTARRTDNSMLRTVLGAGASDERRLVLITAHRRESFGDAFESLCNAVADLVESRPDVLFVYPAHLNPNVQGPVGRILRPLAERVDNLLIPGPMPYHEFVALMKRSHLILTDSGGIQEEAPGLGKPVLVMRETTERQEAIEAGTACLVGTSRELIVRETLRLLDDTDAYRAMSGARNPFGDGKAAERIVQHCCDYLEEMRQNTPEPSLQAASRTGHSG